ncbi:hypothetical protein [Allofournierella sp.]|uniref:hypothetical protein n=1 Tax=Allofournierella sp. TaxID=1940256 RepID=UPI003AB87807
MSARAGRRLPVLLWMLAFAVLELLAFRGAARLGRLYAAPLSLRYARPLTAGQVEAALDDAAGAQREQTVSPTFWRQGTTALKGPAQAADAGVLWYWGEAAQVFPGEYLAGTAPGPWDEAGCAVSGALAWQLWGSLDAVGQRLEVEGAVRTVRGVFRERKALVLAASSPAAGAFTAVELAAAGLTAEEARAFAQNCGLGAPDFMVYGEGLVSLAVLAAWLPAGVLALAALVRLALWSRSWPPLARQSFWLLALVGAALALPLLLGLVPGWLLPGRWSDFGFWIGLAQRLAAQGEEWFSLPPTLREVQAKGLLLAQAALAAGLALCTQRLLWAAKQPPQAGTGARRVRCAACPAAANAEAAAPAPGG